MTAYYVNVADWTPEQVADWVRGLDDTLLPYIRYIVEQEVNGYRLLSTTVEDLPGLRIDKLGHQEIFMSAIDLLRDFHYNLDRENLQFLAMQLGCKARSLYNELRVSSQSSRGKSEQVTTSTLAAVANIIDAVKDLVTWLDRAPFDGHEPYLSVKGYLLKICLELATNAQRDLFAERPVEVIRQGCISLAGITDKIICELVDPLVLQPASLDVATVKKKPEEDLALHNSHSLSNGTDGMDMWIQGMLIQTSYKGVHVIGGVKFQSPAHQCGKIEEGDEVVQVNYQTVVGWQQKKLKAAMLENAAKIILTLKKRPRHSNNFGQIYVKPYRLPSKKRDAYHFRWHLNADGQTKADLQLSKPTDVQITSIPSVQVAPAVMTELTAAELPSEVESDNDTDDDSFLPDSHHDPAVAAAAAAAVAAATGTDSGAVASPASVRLILPKNRLSIQRRATVTGASPTSSRPPLNIEQFWKELKEGHGQRSKAPELFDLLMQQQHQLHLEQRPHSSMGHYNGLSRQVRQTDWNANHPQTETTKGAQDVTKDGAASTSVNRVINEEPSEGAADPRTTAGEEDVEIRNPSRKTSQERPRLDKSQSTPTYESVLTDSASFEEKLRNIRLRKQSRVGEEEDASLAEAPTQSVTPSPVHDDDPRLSPKPALPPRNKTRSSDGEVPDETVASSPLSGQSPNDLRTDVSSTTVAHNGNSVQEDAGGSLSSRTLPQELSHLGLRPHEIRDLIRRGLWPRHPADEERALPALTRVTRLDSNFDPVPGSTVPRIAPSLLVTYASASCEDEEVHVALPPRKYASKPIGSGGSVGSTGSPLPHHSPIGSTSASRMQYQHLHRYPAQQQQLQQQHQHQQLQENHTQLHHRPFGAHLQHTQSGRTGSPADGGRRVPCRELGEGDCQGWLSRRRQTRGFWSGPRWIRRFFVLKRHTLYGYRDPEDVKAESLICLPGFSSAPAPEVKSKKFAFKVFNSGTVFYFACENGEDLEKWLNSVMQSATAAYSHVLQPARDAVSAVKGVYYSETEDESLDESENKPENVSHSLGRRKGKGSVTRPSQSVSPPVHSPTKRNQENSSVAAGDGSPSPVAKISRSPMVASLDRKYLKRFLRVAPEKQPVPTPQFRSYRKPSPSPSPTTPSAPSALPQAASPRTRATDVGAKPPPRPPSESKPASPYKPSGLTNFSDQNRTCSFEFPPTTTRQSTEGFSPGPKSPRSHPADTATFRKSMSTSKLSGRQTGSHNHQQPQPRGPLALPVEVVDRKRSEDLTVSPRRPISRRHSVELADAKKQSLSQTGGSSVKPQLAPKPVHLSMRTLGRPSTGSGCLTNNLMSSSLDRSDGGQQQRRTLHSSLNRGSREAECAESGYAKIRPRHQSSSNAADYFRNTSNRMELSVRRSSVSSSRRSSADSSVRSSGNSSSLSKLPSPNASVSPHSPSKGGAFDFNTDRTGRGYLKEGPPDQLWINSLRGGTQGGAPPVAPKPLISPNRLKNAGGQVRLKSAACYQPMNFPVNPKEDPKMKAAFEMNLDISSMPVAAETDVERPKSATADAKNFFKMLVSPKFGRKTTSPQLPPKQNPTARESLSPPVGTTPRMQKTLLGSPRLHRAIFGTPKEKRKNKALEGAAAIGEAGTSAGQAPAFNSRFPLPMATQEEVATTTAFASFSTDTGNESLSSFNSSLSSEFSPRNNSPSLRLIHRPPPLISPHHLSSNSPTVANHSEEPITSSCPGTPKTPVLKPAMGVSMIGKQRRTPLASDSPSSIILPPPLGSPSLPNGGGGISSTLCTPTSMAAMGATMHFTYTLANKEPSHLIFPPTGGGELEYPPVFEPGTYSLSAEQDKKSESLSAVGMSRLSSLSSPSSVLPPVPAPRTKFLTSPPIVRPSNPGSVHQHSSADGSTPTTTTVNNTASTFYRQHRAEVLLDDSSSSNV